MDLRTLPANPQGIRHRPVVFRTHNKINFLIDLRKADMAICQLPTCEVKRIQPSRALPTLLIISLSFRDIGQNAQRQTLKQSDQSNADPDLEKDDRQHWYSQRTRHLETPPDIRHSPSARITIKQKIMNATPDNRKYAPASQNFSC